MCGICGLVDFNNEGKPDRSLLESMTRELAHRGPDDRGTFNDRHVGLGHTRLSILDLTSAGRQPMQSDDGQVTLIHNGEIYNFRELRTTLRKEGYPFHSRSDTEVLLKSYLRWGVGAFAKLSGMFAFAIWDQRVRALFLVRDRFGIKPLYYRRFPFGLVFGSEIKAILRGGPAAAGISPAGLGEFLYYGAALGDRTLYQGIRKLRPASVLRFDRNSFHIDPFWSAESVPSLTLSRDEAVRQLRGRMESAVARHLISDVPVGVFLSGGIDSSCITAFASRHYAGRLKTYSAGFDFNDGPDERRNAKRVAERFGTDHHEILIRATALQDLLETLVRCHDEPFGDPANIPLYLLNRELGGSMKVVLQGDGGDEVFGGYRRYSLLGFSRLWRAVSGPMSHLNRLTPASQGRLRRSRMLDALGQSDSALRMALLLTPESRWTHPESLLSDEWRRLVARHDPFREYRLWNERLRDRDPVQRMLLTDTQVLLPNVFLEKVDKPSMAHGVEVRVPMLDRDLTEFALGLPASLKVDRGRKKWLLRQSLRGVLADEVLDAPKRGLKVPLSNWFRGPLAEFTRSVLLDPGTLRSGLFSPGVVKQAIDEHRSGRRDRGRDLHRALNLALWMRACRPSL